MIRSGVRCLSENSESGLLPTYVSSCIGYIDCIFFLHEKIVSLFIDLPLRPSNLMMSLPIMTLSLSCLACRKEFRVNNNLYYVNISYSFLS